MNVYRIDDLTLENVPVWFTLGAGDLMGVMHITARGKRIYRVFESQDRPRAGQTRDLDRFATPWAWRPVNPAKWPIDLPEPATLLDPTLNIDAMASNSRQDGQTQVDGWPRQGLRLGKAGKPPTSLVETEARIIHAIRTFWVLYGGKAHSVGYVVAKWLEGTGDGVDGSDATPIPARWMPTPRDVSDVEGALTWIAGLDPADGGIIKCRAAMPVWSWRQIGDDLGLVKSTVIARYQGAIRQAMRTALASST